MMADDNEMLKMGTRITVVQFWPATDGSELGLTFHAGATQVEPITMVIDPERAEALAHAMLRQVEICRERVKHQPKN